MDKIVYRVGEGEGIDEICERFSCDTQEVLMDNGLRREEVAEGVRLILVLRGGRRHVVRPFETVERIAERYNISAESIRSRNNINEVFVGEIIYI